MNKGINQKDLKLRPLHSKDEKSFKEAVRVFKKEEPPFEFAFGFNEAECFDDYIKRLKNWSEGKELPAGWVPSTFLVGVVEGRIVGRISLRHCLNDFLEKVGGHIGYGVVPRKRNRSYATEMLKKSLPFCSSVGLKKVLITCDTDNTGSERVIEKCGGIFEGITDDPELKVQKKRYWIHI